MTYLNDSEMLRDKERRDRESQHLRFLLVTGLAIAFIVMAAAAAVGWYYTTRQSKSRTIAYLASSETDLARALLYGTQAVSTSPTFEARSSLVTLLGRNPHLRKFLHGHSGLVTSVSFAPDGTFAASGSTDGRVLLWDVEAGTSRTLFEGGVPVHSVGFSPNGALLAAGLGDGSIALWDVKAGRPLQALRSNQKDVRSVAFSGDGDRLAAGTVDGTLVVWTGLAGTEGDHARATMEPVILTGGKNDVQSVAFSPSEPLLAASHWDGSIVLWELNRRRQRGELQHKPRAFSLAFTPDGQTLISGGDDTMIRAWNIADMKETFEKPLGGEAPVRSVAISRDGRLLAAAGDDRRIRMWEIAPGPSFQLQDIVPRSFEILHERPLHSVAFSPDGLRLLSGGEDKRVILWNVAQESLAERIIAQPHGASLQYLTWSSDGSELAWLDDDRHVVRWSLRTHTPEVGKATMPGATNASLNFDAGARLLWSGVSDHEFSRVDSSTGTKVGASVPLSGILTSSVAVSRDGRLLAYGVQSEKDAKGSYGIVVWDLEARGERRSIHTRGPVVALAMNAAGTKLASTSGANAVTLWNAATGAEVSQLTSADRSFRSLAFSTDGSHLAAGTFDRQRPEIIIWDLDVGRALGVLATGHHGSINSLSFGPDAYSIASADDDIDGTIRLWTLEPQAVQARACETANRDVTPDEWSVIVGPNAPRSGPCRR
jgi:WD40 repeat protein